MLIWFLVAALSGGTGLAAWFGARRVLPLAFGGAVGAGVGVLALRFWVTRQFTNSFAPAPGHRLVAFAIADSPWRNATANAVTIAAVLALSLLSAFVVKSVIERWRPSA